MRFNGPNKPILTEAGGRGQYWFIWSIKPHIDLYKRL
jgi:hypothetical protein